MEKFETPSRIVIQQTIKKLAAFFDDSPFLAAVDHKILLQQPPVRYIYDLIMAMDTKSVFLDKILTPIDRDRSIVMQNQGTKTAFFAKTLSVLGTVENSDILNLLNGQQPSKTIVLLQKLAELAERHTRQKKTVAFSKTAPLIETEVHPRKNTSLGVIGSMRQDRILASPTKKVTVFASKSEPSPVEIKPGSRSSLGKLSSACQEAASSGDDCVLGQSQRSPNAISSFPMGVHAYDGSSESPKSSKRSVGSENCEVVSLRKPNVDSKGYSSKEKCPCAPTKDVIKPPPDTESTVSAFSTMEQTIEEMRQLAEIVRQLKLENDSLTGGLQLAEQKMRNATMSLNVLENYRIS